MQILQPVNQQRSGVCDRGLGSHLGTFPESAREPLSGGQCNGLLSLARAATAPGLACLVDSVPVSAGRVARPSSGQEEIMTRIHALCTRCRSRS